MTNDRQFAATNDGRVCALFNVDIVCYFSERCYFFFACPVVFFFAVYLHCELDGRTSKRLLFGYESQADLVRNAHFFFTKTKRGSRPKMYLLCIIGFPPGRCGGGRPVGRVMSDLQLR